MEEALIQRVMRSSDVSKSQAIAILKDRGMLTQKGERLQLTEKGRSAAEKAHSSSGSSKKKLMRKRS